MSVTRSERHPFLSLLLLLLFVLAGGFVASLLAFAVALPLFGIKPFTQMASGLPVPLDFIRLLQIFSSIGMFVLPAIFFARFEASDWRAYLKLRSFLPTLLGLTLLLMLSAGPLVQILAEFNKGMELPPFLHEIEKWMKVKELQMAEMTKRLLEMNSTGMLMLNLFMLAVIPAIGEEFIFRGCLQNLFTRWTGNVHAAIWIAAFIFSAIHFQFYGFLPRMLLGALFGYLLHWSGSMWLPVVGHFINNAVAVLGAYILQQRGMSLEYLESTEIVPWYGYLLSAVAFSGLVILFQRTSKVHDAG